MRFERDDFFRKRSKASKVLALPLLFASHIGVAIGLLVWGGAAFAIVPPVRTRVMEAASEAPGLASSINVGAFNLGNTLGAAIGAAVISLGFGYAAVSIAGGLLAAAGLALVLIGDREKSSQLALSDA